MSICCNWIVLQKRVKSKLGPRPELNEKELKNAEKQVAYAEAEFQKLTERVEQVSNPQYVIELKERLIAFDDRIRKMGKNKKKLEVAQIHREKKMHKVIEIGEPEMCQEIQKTKTEYTTMDKKAIDQDASLEKGAEMLKEYNKKMSELTSQFKKLETEATSLGMDVAAIVQGREKVDPLQEKHKTLEQAHSVLTKDINLIRTRHNVSFADFSKNKSRLHEKLSEVATKIQKKNEYKILNNFQ